MDKRILPIIIVALLLSACVVYADDSDAKSTEAIGSKVIRGATVFTRTTNTVEYAPNVFCFEAGSDDDEAMEKYVTDRSESMPMPLTSNIPGVDSYRMYTLDGGKVLAMSERMGFTVDSDGAVSLKLKSTSDVTISTLNNSMTTTDADVEAELDAGDIIFITPESVGSFSELWVYVDYDITNVRVYESNSLSETKILGYVLIGLGAICLIAIIMSKRSPLSNKAFESIRPSKPILGKIGAILIVAIVIGGCVYAYINSPGSSDVDSLEFKEGLTIEWALYENDEYSGRGIVTLDSVIDDDYNYTQKRYDRSGNLVSSSSHSVSLSTFRSIIGYYGSPSDILSRGTEGIELGRETVDLEIGKVRCDRYSLEEDDYTMKYYIYHGLVLKEWESFGTDTMCMEVKSISYE